MNVFVKECWESTKRFAATPKNSFYDYIYFTVPCMQWHSETTALDLAHECWLLNEPCPPQPNAIGHCHNICFKCLVYLVNEHSFLIQGIELWFPGMRAKTITKWEKGKPQSRVTEPMFLYSWFWGVFSLFHEVYQIITQSPPPLNICLGLGGWVSLTSLYPFEIKMAAFFVAMTTCMICGQTVGRQQIFARMFAKMLLLLQTNKCFREPLHTFG